MSEDQRAGLLARLQDDAELLGRLEAAPDAQAAVELARRAGFEVSADDWRAIQAALVSELSDDALQSVAGGISWDEQMPSGITIA